VETSTPRARYLAIAEEIRHRIATGRLRVGDRVPSARQISREWGVAIATATRVLAALRESGLVRPVPGSGTVVVARDGAPAGGRARVGPRRERGAETSREHVVRTAIAVADDEGFAALSMRRIATRLGVATMSLYRHVRGRDELFLAMIDEALGEEPLPDPPPPGWRAQIEVSARLQWTVYRRHQWLARIISLTRPLLAPNAMAHTEWIMRAVGAAGVADEPALAIAMTVTGHVQGTAVNLEAEWEARRDSGIDNVAWMSTQDSRLASVTRGGRFPLLARVAAQPDLDTTFEHGLALMLDGLAAGYARQDRTTS